MKIVVLISFMSIYSLFVLGQKQVNFYETQLIAETVARNFSDLKNTMTKPKLFLSYIGTKDGIIDVKNYFSFSMNDTSYYHIYGIEERKGYVIVSAYDAVEPVLGYSESEIWHQVDLPPSLIDIMNDYKKQIEFAIINKLIPDSILQLKWDNYLSGTIPELIYESGTDYVPGTFLVETRWGQGEPYNHLTPLIDGVRTYTGCVATSITQVLYYWAKSHKKNPTHLHYPVARSAIPSMLGAIRHGPLHTLPHRPLNHDSVDDIQIIKQIPAYTTSTHKLNLGPIEKGTTFEWDRMMLIPNNNTDDQSIAKLMYVAGIAVKMNYGIIVSGAFDNDIIPALEYFGFKGKEQLRITYRGDWDGLLRKEIQENKPIIYSGNENSLAGLAGHSFICDGYKNDGTFHFNFGWNGQHDNWMVTSAINPSTYNYNYNQNIIYAIEPGNKTVGSRPKSKPDPVGQAIKTIEDVVTFPIKVVKKIIKW